MKLKNHYIWLFIIWSIATIANAISSTVNFVDGQIGIGFICLVISIAFAFISGILLFKALEVRNHNWICDMLHDLTLELEMQEKELMKPF
jgi:hypothetical protein